MNSTAGPIVHIRPKMTFLLVDGDRRNITTTSAVIKRMGFKIDRARDMAEALMMCMETCYDVIFMDIDRTETRGFKTARALRSMPNESSGAYIIALSKYIQEPRMVHACIDAGMNDCIVKPLQERVLRQRVKLWSKLYNEGFLQSHTLTSPPKPQ